ncbi:hypothetical protein Tco_0347807 [Tanacetum coccineum]
MQLPSMKPPGGDEVCMVTNNGFKQQSRDAMELISGLMAYFVTFLTPDSAKSCVMQCTLPTQGIRSIISTISIRPEGFLSFILLLVVIIVAIVIVVVILIVVVVVIVRVVIVVMIIGVVVVVTIIRVVVVVGGVSAIIKLSFVIIGFLRRIVFYYLLHHPLGYGNGFLQRYNRNFLEFKTSRDRYGDNRRSDPNRSFEFLLQSFRKLMPGGGVVNLTGDEDPTDEDRDIEIGDSTEVSVSFGDEIFSKGSGKMFLGEAEK